MTCTCHHRSGFVLKHVSCLPVSAAFEVLTCTTDETGQMWVKGLRVLCILVTPAPVQQATSRMSVIVCSHGVR